MIDTLGIAEELAEAGVFTREQADRQAKVMAKIVAEKHDNLATKVDIKHLEKATKDDIKHLKDDIQQVEKSLEKFAGTTRWLISICITLVTMTVAGVLAILIVVAW